MITKYTLAVFMLICLPFISMGQSTMSISITGYDASCNGSASGGAKVTVFGGAAPYSYHWSATSAATDSIGGLVAGTYSVTVTDHHGMQATGAITIEQKEPITVSIGANIVRPCFLAAGGGACGCSNTLWAIVSGGTPPYSYSWNPSGETGDTLLHACYLEFTVTVTDKNNCVSSSSIDVTAPGGGSTAVSQVNNASAISAYPNPAASLLNVSIGPGANVTNLGVYNMLGQKVFYRNLTGSERLVILDVSTLADGNYLLKATGNEAQQTIHFSVLK